MEGFLKIKVLDSAQEVAEWVVQQIRFNIIDYQAIGLATGQTMIPIYEEWVKDYQRQPYSLDHIHWFLLDELLGLPDSHVDLYQTFLEKRLLNPLNVENSKRHFPRNLQQPSLSAADYEKEILKFNGLDLQLLGIGGNGHIGLNEPGTDPNLSTHVTFLADKTKQHHHRFADDQSLVPDQALTQGFATIVKHKALYLVATGENKKTVMKDFFLMNKKDNSFPASHLKDHANLTVIMDRKAASSMEVD